MTTNVVLYSPMENLIYSNLDIIAIVMIMGLIWLFLLLSIEWFLKHINNLIITMYRKKKIHKTTPSVHAPKHATAIFQINVKTTSLVLSIAITLVGVKIISYYL